ncbi:hypothetical protein Ga0123461_2166 [Mariprofundus aestuarium]|uniref:AsmA family protein n=1 Tax=Mariprofundus aestuarium TaxID=1921086 RepID=A0A2K8L0J1_MARES|nr:hypothetical protein [Mariprofundus aestuarium]ATX80572.1 hypothetical protein Ga0123461_2166 [Mariprofundus aestuarium]
MGKVIRYTLLSIATVVLLLFAAPVLLPSDVLKDLVEEHASRTSGMAVSVGGVSLRLFPVVELRAVNIVAGEGEGAVSEMHAESGAVLLALLPLIRGSLELSGFELIGIEMKFPKRAGGAAKPVLHIDSVNGKVRISRDQVKLDEWQAILYDGEVKLDAVVSPAERGQLSMVGRATLHTIQLQPLILDVGAHQSLNGTLSAELDISTEGRWPAAIQNGLKADGPVRIRSGQLMLGGLTIGYDLIRFSLQARGVDQHLNNLEIFSPLINAAGDVSVVSNRNLHGTIRTAGLLSGEMLVGGTIDHPQLTPVAVPQASSAGD